MGKWMVVLGMMTEKLEGKTVGGDEDGLVGWIVLDLEGCPVSSQRVMATGGGRGRAQDSRWLMVDG